MNKVLDYEQPIFDDMFELIRPEGQWTQGALARLPDGSSTFPDDPNASCWCLEGAFAAAAGQVEKDHPTYVAEVEAAADSLWIRLREWLRESEYQCTYPAAFNDKHTHLEVIEMLQKFGEDSGFLPNSVTE